MSISEFFENGWIKFTTIVVVALAIALVVYFTFFYDSGSDATTTPTVSDSVAAEQVSAENTSVRLISSELATSSRVRNAARSSNRENDIHEFIEPEEVSGKMLFLVIALDDPARMEQDGYSNDGEDSGPDEAGESNDVSQRSDGSPGGNDKPHVILLGDSADVTQVRTIDDSALLDFDLKGGTNLNNGIRVTDSVKSSTLTSWAFDQFIILATYIDVTFEHSESTHVVRFAMATHGAYQLGDVLMQRDGVFNWYDVVNASWVPETGTRPDVPAQSSRLRKEYVAMTANDPDLANFPFMPYFAYIKAEDSSDREYGVVVDGIQTATRFQADVDFKLGKMLILPGLKDQTLTDEELIQSVTLLTDMRASGAEDGGCQQSWYQKVEDFLANAPKDDQGRPIVGDDVFEEGDGYVEFKKGEIRFFDDGQITVKGNTVCESGGGFSEDDKLEMNEWGIQIELNNLVIS